MVYALIEDEWEKDKKESYQKVLGIPNIVCYNDIEQVLKLLEKNDGVLIKSFLVDRKESQKDLEKLNNKFEGVIIAKVPDDKMGLELLRANLIDEYYVHDDNFDKELINLAVSYKSAHDKKTFQTRVNNFKRDLKIIKSAIRPQ